MPESAATLVGAGVVLLVAMFSGFAWLTGNMRRIEQASLKALSDAMDKQNEYRHNNTDRISTVIAELDDKVDSLHSALDNFRVDIAGRLGSIEGRVTSLEARLRGGSFTNPPQSGG